MWYFSADTWKKTKRTLWAIHTHRCSFSIYQRINNYRPLMTALIKDNSIILTYHKPFWPIHWNLLLSLGRQWDFLAKELTTPKSLKVIQSNVQQVLSRFETYQRVLHRCFAHQNRNVSFFTPWYLIVNFDSHASHCDLYWTKFCHYYEVAITWNDV